MKAEFEGAGGNPTTPPVEEQHHKSLEEYLGYKCPMRTECRHDMCGSVKREDIIGWFQSFDANKNGVIDKPEAKSDQNLEQIFDAVNGDGNEYIDFKEVCRYEEIRASERHWRDRPHEEL